MSADASAEYGFGTEGGDSGFETDANVGMSQELWSGEVGVAAAEGSVNIGGVEMSGSALSASAEGQITADLSFTDGTASINAEFGASANLIEGSVSTNVAGVDLAAEGMVGASAEATGSIEFDPLNGSLGASGEVGGFAGAQVEGSAGMTGDYGTAEVGGSLRAGIGAEASGDIGFDDGKFSLSGNVGATLGIGGSVSFDVEVDVYEVGGDIVDAGSDLIDSGREFFSDPLGSLGF
jgi:hypothetical protein